jgi:phage replication-related protein YjqB (UPF0714/DUF867 family)
MSEEVDDERDGGGVPDVFAALLATPGVREVCELRGAAGSGVGFMAFHGGGLEAMTDVIAGEAAERAGASFYAVVQPNGLDWHIPSHLVTPTVSPALRSFVEHVDVAITVHGYGRQGMWTALLLGGRNRRLAEHLAGELRAGLPDYDIVTELEAIPSELRGLHADNPANLPRDRGVQIELPPRVRGRSPFWAEWTGPGHNPHTEALIAGLAAAAISWIPTPEPRRD